MGEGERDYEVVLTDRAKRDYLTIVAKPDSISVNNILDALDTLPYIGRVYDPLYDAARTPFELRVAYAGAMESTMLSKRPCARFTCTSLRTSGRTR